MNPRRRIDVAEAATLIAQHMPACAEQMLPLDDCTGAILRQPVTAERDQPPFDRVTMDGIAIRASEPQRQSFRLIGTQAAGAPPLSLTSDSDCVEIMTGAALPPGADTVVPVERIERDGETITLASGYLPERGSRVRTSLRPAFRSASRASPRR